MRTPQILLLRHHHALIPRGGPPQPTEDTTEVSSPRERRGGGIIKGTKMTVRLVAPQRRKRRGSAHLSGGEGGVLYPITCQVWRGAPEPPIYGRGETLSLRPSNYSHIFNLHPPCLYVPPSDNHLLGNILRVTLGTPTEWIAIFRG